MKMRKFIDQWVYNHSKKPIHCIEVRNPPKIAKKLQRDYDTTMQYLSQISKEQFDFIGPVLDEIVYPFQKLEMVELLENLYRQFYGESKDTEFYQDSIEGLRGGLKNQ